ncbi:hypothetical protein GCK72_015283 [Caenorhabditis remanei]|uniref:F-box associated domain-containing protein n=2 Tax=Caenorhabditis remanei TaxID=31234 RepID=A0A6A5GWM5_CAERE|nr:hypothetical protein GCK72_015283 [Caenorhabditis remanei]KAF1758823.1 hypothetical protein GCK72_015283 [Caenorhabditis remanei]
MPQNLDQTVENKINQYYMGGRTSVHVKRLEVFGPHADLALPVDSKFKITELDAKHCNFEYYLPIIDPISFPLKYLRCKLAGLHTYNHPVFRSAESLAFNIFEEQSEAEMICLHKLPCKTISFEHYSLDMIDMVSMIRYWMKHPKEIGTKYTFVEFDSKLVYSELIHLKREFEEIRHDLEGTTVKGNNYPRFLISLTLTSKLHVYAIDNNEPHLLNFIIKLVPESGAEFSGTEQQMGAQLSIE